MKPSIDNLEQAAVVQQCRALRLPAVADQCASLAEEAIKQRLTYLRYLEELLATELEERERNTIARRIKDAHLPRMKTLDEFDFSKAPQIAATKIHELAQGGYIERAEPINSYWRLRHRQDASSNWAMRGCLPAEATSALCYGRRAGQRTGRGQAAVATAPCAGPMGTL